MVLNLAGVKAAAIGAATSAAASTDEAASGWLLGGDSVNSQWNWRINRAADSRAAAQDVLGTFAKFVNAYYTLVMQVMHGI